MKFKAVRTKAGKKYVKSGRAIALFPEDQDFDQMLSFGMAYPKDAYEIVTAEVTILEDKIYPALRADMMEIKATIELERQHPKGVITDCDDKIYLIASKYCED